VSAHRDLPLIRRLIKPGRAGALQQPDLFCTDGLGSYVRAIRETFRDAVATGACGRPRLHPWPTLLIAQVVKQYEQYRVVDIERRIIQGTATQIAEVRAASPGDGVLNTAYIERLNATFRERLASLTRRGRALSRPLVTREHGMYLLGTVYNFGTGHESLRVARTTTAAAVMRTPAMAAGSTDHCGTIRELLSFQVPPPQWTPPTRRGRPSRVLQRLVERWCS
jgi:plasmid stabilization system protein ParE